MMSKLLLAAALAATAAWAATTAPQADAQQMYRWTDKNGKVHYTDSPPPQSGAATVEQRRIAAPAPADAGGPLDFATQKAAKDFPVTIFTAPNCQAPCKDARDLLARRGVPFSEVQVVDEAARERLKKVSGDTQVPVLTVGRDVTKGYEPGMWTSALDSAGYPKSVLRRPVAAASPAASPAAGADTKGDSKGDAKPATEDGPATRAKGKYLP